MSSCLTKSSQKRNHGNCVFIESSGVRRAKNSPLIEPGCLRWIGFSENASLARTDDETIAEGANIRRQSRIHFANALRPPSVAAATYGALRDNAFHQLELPAVFPFR
jgi:hypothetical protein